MSGRFVLTCDFEDWHQLVHRRIGRPDWRTGGPACDRHVRIALDLLDELDVKATFFVAGIAAAAHPEALREVVARGHDIAAHGYEHVRAYVQGPTEFRRDLARCVGVVEDVCGVRPVGYRAPWFSINRDAQWAYEALREQRFRYSSSAYDSPRLPRRITPVPNRPFEAAPGLWEYPIASWRHGRFVLPVGGGAYWRAMPGPLLRSALAEVARTAVLPVLYFHPYECAPEPLAVMMQPGEGAAARARETGRRLYKNARRDLIGARLREVAARFDLVSFREVIPDLGDAAVVRPARALV